MSEKYSYLRAPQALEEIRKHQWIEGVKKGEPVGFPSAALDWIRKYGEAFRRYHNRRDLQTLPSLRRDEPALR